MQCISHHEHWILGKTHKKEKEKLKTENSLVHQPFLKQQQNDIRTYQAMKSFQFLPLANVIDSLIVLILLSR